MLSNHTTVSIFVCSTTDIVLYFKAVPWCWQKKNLANCLSVCTSAHRTLWAELTYVCIFHFTFLIQISLSFCLPWEMYTQSSFFSRWGSIPAFKGYATIHCGSFASNLFLLLLGAFLLFKSRLRWKFSFGMNIYVNLLDKKKYFGGCENHFRT